MIYISQSVTLSENELEFSAIRSQGAGGQNVNKVATAIHLRFDIHASSLPDFYKQALLRLSDQRISKEGVVVIKAQDFRTQERNKQDAIERLVALVQQAGVKPKTRRPTKPSKSAKNRRMDKKTLRGKTKSMRGRVKF